MNKEEKVACNNVDKLSINLDKTEKFYAADTADSVDDLVEKKAGELVEQKAGELAELMSGELAELMSGELAEPYMYILLCGNGSYYVGSTKYLEKRIARHQKGEGAKYTKLYPPVTQIYFEKYDRIQEAFKREKQIQKWSRAKKEALINGDVEELKRLAKSRT